MAACDFFPESVFMLSQESRLPSWFELPVGVARTDVSVKMSYYASGIKFEFRNDKTGSRLASIKGEVLNDEPLTVSRINPAFPPGKRAGYSVVRVRGIVEIVEHRRASPVFDISDDPEVRAELFEILRKTQGIEGLK
jgi:hypothetical protein